MQLISSNSLITAETVRLADLANHIVINSQPYTKAENAAVPFNPVCLDRSQDCAIGKGQMPFYTKVYAGGGVATSYNQLLAPVKRIANCIVDNLNPRVTYSLPSARSVLAPKYRIYKNTENENGTISTQFTEITYAQVVTSDSSQNIRDCICSYITQNNDYVFFVVQSTPLHNLTYYAYVSSCCYTYVIRLNKETMQYTSTIIGNSVYQAGNGSYNTQYIRGIQVLAENEEGLVIYSKAITTAVQTTPYLYYSDIVYYSFASATQINLTRIGETLPSITSNVSWATSPTRCSIACDPIDTGSAYETYLVESSVMSDASTIDKMYKLTIDKTDLTQVTISEVVMDFTESSVVNILPISTLLYVRTSNGAGVMQNTNGIHDGFVVEYADKRYLHIFFKTMVIDANSGIYTFEIDELTGNAIFKSFYQAPGQMLKEWNLLNVERDQILMSTNSLYQILRFDYSTLTWKPTFVQNAIARNLIFTDNNKLLVELEDRSIREHSLTGAIEVDFRYEMSQYDVNTQIGADSFIEAWAVDADGNYVAQNVRVVIQSGDIVWKANGAKVYEFTTSDAGPTAVPFTIQGEAKINIGIDALSA